jgi:hypothetical protein
MLLELAEQSIQLLTCHISRGRLCHRSPQDNQSGSWKKVWPLFFLSLITSHAITTSRAEHTTSYRGRATTSFISYHQLKTWSLLSKDNQSKSWEKVWGNWNCLSLVTSHVVGTSRAEHTTSYMSCIYILYPYIQAINLNLRRRCGQTKIGCHCSLLMLLAPAEQSIQLLKGAEQQLLLYHTIN